MYRVVRGDLHAGKGVSAATLAAPPLDIRAPAGPSRIFSANLVLSSPESISRFHLLHPRPAASLRHVLRFSARPPPGPASHPDTGHGAPEGAPTALPPLRDEPFKLPDGRILGTREIGAENGRPLLLFPSMIDARHAADPLGRAAAKHNTRLVTLERPGLGISTPQAGRSLLDWADDVRHFAEGRNMPRFGVLGLVQGGAHALACARALPPGMLSAVGICSMSAPWVLADPHVSRRSRVANGFLRSWPGAYRAVSGFIARLMRTVTADFPSENLAWPFTT